MTALPSVEQTLSLKEAVEKLIEEWDGRVQEFQRISLIAEGYSERSRMRAKADTLERSRQELILALEEDSEAKTSETDKTTWPSLSGIINSAKR